jgi:hypothetical protein
MRTVAILLCALAVVLAAGAPVAAGAAPPGCGLPGLVRPAGARPCPPGSAVSGGAPRPNSIFSPIGHLLSGLSGKAIKGVFGALVGLAVAGAADALRFTASLIGETSRPALQSTWFSATYWRIGAVSALLTVPFLFAAAVHALVRSDLSLLLRAAFGYLPLAMLGVAIAAPLTSLVLSATDEMSSFVAAASSHSETLFLGRAATGLASASLIGQDPFLGFFVALVTIAATLALWIELLVRAAAVDVIVLMLPLFFAAMVWPARRVWAIRAIETLVALILAKFTIVAVLSLGGAAIGHASSGPAAVLSGAVLITLATLSPWALLRVLPMHEVAAAAAGGLGALPRSAAMSGIQTARGGDSSTADWLRRHVARDALSDPGDATPGTAAGQGADPAAYDPLTRAGVGVVSSDPTPAPAPGPVAAPAKQDTRPVEEAVQAGNFIDDEPMIIGDEPE